MISPTLACGLSLLALQPCSAYALPQQGYAEHGRLTSDVSKLAPPRRRHHPLISAMASQSYVASHSRDESRSTFINLPQGGAEKGSSSSATNAFLTEALRETIGTFIITFLGTGAVFSAIFTQSLVGLYQIAISWIIGVTLAIATTAGHLNPAMSVAFAIIRPSDEFGWKKVLPYSAFQTVGAALASILNFLMYRPFIRAFEQANSIVRGHPASIASAKAFGQYFQEPITAPTAFFVEATGTAVLAFVIFALTNPRNDGIRHNKVFVPPLIGLCVGALIAMLAPITQCGLNPARDFGPRLVAWAAGWGRPVSFRLWWLYVLAPVLGAPIGGFLADRVLFGDKKQPAQQTE